MDKNKQDCVIDGVMEIPISKAYPVIDTDLARDNMENHMPSADLEDME